MGFEILKHASCAVKGPRSCEQDTSQLRGENAQKYTKFQGVLAAANRVPRSCEKHLANFLTFLTKHTPTTPQLHTQTHFIHSKNLIISHHFKKKKPLKKKI